MSEREWLLYLDDMIAFCEKVLVYRNGLDQDAFEASGRNYDAIVRNLELIGEAATHMPDPVRASHIDSMATNHRNSEQANSWVSWNR